MTTLEFHFDFASPTTYLAYSQLPALAQETGVTLAWRPMLLGGVFKATGNAGPMSVPAKGRWMHDDIAHWARHWRVPFTFNPHFPINTVTLMRGACGLLMRQPDDFRRYADAIFHAMWVAPRNLNDPAELACVLTAAGFDAAAFMAMVGETEVKADLIARTEAAVARGAFGAPTCFVGNQMFFGQDRLHFVRDALNAATAQRAGSVADVQHTADESPKTAGPLKGVRVIDLTTVVSGPVSTVLLADQGADVVKIEPPTGDISRSLAGGKQFTPMFVSCNRGKRSLALDLKKPAALEVLRRLIANADVLVQNFRPGTMERMGLDEATIRALNPRLVYVSISGVGETGPYVNKRVYDPVIQSMSGFADIQANQSTGRPQLVRTIVADKTTAVYASQAICAALFARQRTGEGQHIRLSMLDTMVAYLWPEGMTQYTVVGNEASAQSPTARPDLIFPTQDGYITVGSVSDSEWRGLCGVLGRPEWIEDPRFKTAGKRSANAAERITLVAEVLAQGRSQDWLDKLDAAEVPCSPVLRRGDVMNNVQVINNRLIEQFEQPGLGQVRQVRPAARFGGTPARIAGPAPALGQHTDAVLAELGYRDDEIAELKTAQAAKSA